MKRVVCMICVSWSVLSAFAQTSTLCISTDKTTSLVFPYPILHVDRGTKDVLVQPVKEVNNILLIKAAVKNFSETNISIVTGDGSIYSFVVSYNSNPGVWIFRLPIQTSASIETYANSILDNKRTIKGSRDEKWDILSKIIGLYVKGNVMYYQLKLDNQSPLDYDIDFIRFYIRDKKKGKRTAIQENELKPLYMAGNCSEIKANSTSSIVVALEKFTIPDAKYLAIEINEKNGGRNLFMKVSNKKIVKAIRLPDLK